MALFRAVLLAITANYQFKKKRAASKRAVGRVCRASHVFYQVCCEIILRFCPKPTFRRFLTLKIRILKRLALFKVVLLAIAANFRNSLKKITRGQQTRRWARLPRFARFLPSLLRNHFAILLKNNFLAKFAAKITVCAPFCTSFLR